jgi:hypothetical protein
LASEAVHVAVKQGRSDEQPHARGQIQYGRHGCFSNQCLGEQILVCVSKICEQSLRKLKFCKKNCSDIFLAKQF